MIVTQITRGNVDDVHRAVQAALSDVASSMGMQVSAVKLRWTKSYAKLTATIAVVSDGVVKSPDRIDLERLHPEWVDRAFESGSVEYQIVGYRRRARRYPVKVVRQHDGATFYFSTRAIDACIAP